MRFFLFLLLSTVSILEPRKEIPKPVGRVIRYNCIVSETQPKTGSEILCFENDGRMFRPERRFDRFILEVPTL